MVNWSKNGEGRTRAGEEEMPKIQVELNEFQTTVRTLSFHPDDVPVFEAPDATELLRELLVEEMNWDIVGSHTVSWGDSGTPSYWEVKVTPEGIQVDEYEAPGGYLTDRTTFNGVDWRKLTRRALVFLSDQMS